MIIGNFILVLLFLRLDWENERDIMWRDIPLYPPHTAARMTAGTLHSEGSNLASDNL